jgi:hypothetical protein
MALLTISSIAGGQSRCLPPALDFGDAREFFGGAVAALGDTAAVSASAEPGVYVYQKSGENWRRVARIAINSEFAQPNEALAIVDGGNEILVGVPGKTHAGVERAGVVERYRLELGIWTLVQTLASPDPQVAATFGGRLSIDGNFLVIGSHTRDVNGVLDAGAAYVFERVAGVYEFRARLTAETPTPNARLGFANSAAAGRVALGAATETVNGVQSAGQVRVYSLGSTPSLLQTIPGSTTFGQFGSSVAMEGQRMVVSNNLQSAPQVTGYLWDGSAFQPSGVVLSMAASESAQDTLIAGGLAYIGVVPLSGPGIAINERVEIVDLANNARRNIPTPYSAVGASGLPTFGSSLALSEETLLVGASGADVLANVDQGEAHFFNTMSLQPRRVAARHGGGRAPSQLGARVIADGDRLWVGEPGFDGALEDVGRVRELIPAVGGWSVGLEVRGTVAAAGFGTALARGEGFLAVASQFGDTATRLGRVDVYETGVTGLVHRCRLQPLTDPTVADFGIQVVASGDRIAVVHGLLAGRRVHLYSYNNGTCSNITTLTAASVSQPANSLFAQDISFVGELLAIGNPRFSPPSTNGQIHIMQPAGNSYSLLTNLVQSGQPTSTLALGTEVEGNANSLVALRQIGSLNGNPVRGAAYIYQRTGSSFSAPVILEDPATAPSLFGSFFGLTRNQDQFAVGTRLSDGRRAMLRSLVAAPAWLGPNAVAEDGQQGSLFLSSTRAGAGLPLRSTSGSTGIGVLKAFALPTFDPLPDFSGTPNDLVHCADFDQLPD